MKNGGKKWVVGVFLVIVLVGAGWLFFGHNNEPTYESKPVSYWFKRYCLSQHYGALYADGHDDAIEPLRAMGSNALPYLVSVAFSTNTDSPVRISFYNLLAKLPDSWNLPQFITQDEIRYCANEAIQEIGPSAGEILLLTRTELNQTNSLQHREAIFLLSCVSNDVELVVPHLAKALRDPDSVTQSIAVDELGDLGPKASVALPELMDVLERAHPGDRIRWKVTSTLEMIGSNAAPAIPQLKEAFEVETDWVARGRLASCLYKIDPRQSYALDYLVGMIANNAKPEQIAFGAETLGDIGQGAKVAIPAFLDVLKTTNCDDGASGNVVRALKHLGASNDLIMPVLKPKLETGSDKLREDVLNEIRNLDPSEHEADLVLVDLILKHSTNERWAIVELGRIGSKAKEAVPVLMLEMNGINKELSTTAEFALWKIDPKAVEK